MSNSNKDDIAQPTFPLCLPKERLGTRHDTLEAFRQAAGITSLRPKRTKEYTLIVVTETTAHRQQRILLGLKNRGFGAGKYNSFGGKFLHDETTDDGVRESVEECACRELEEETNINIPLEEMTNAKVGIQRFTFDDNDKEMLVHLFFLDLAYTANYPSSNSESTNEENLYNIQPCDEITPRWFDSFDAVPFDNMFADDSLWLTALLSEASATPWRDSSKPQSAPLHINGSYHFQEKCEESNSILHYHMDVQHPNAMA